MKRIEKRLELSIRVKAIEDVSDGSGKVEGYATTFDDTPDLDGDRVLAGAAGAEVFTVPLLAYHDRKMPVGSATLTPDGLGVRAEATYANTTSCQDLRELVRAKAVPAFSIGFWSDDYVPNDFGGMDFKSIHIYELSLVPIPANPRALVTAAKSLGGAEAAELQNEDKQYVDVEPPAGSFEAVHEDLREALRDLYSSGSSYVSVISTFDDRVVYSVESYPSIPVVDGTWQVTYSIGEDGALTLGAPQAVEITQTVVSDDVVEPVATEKDDDAPAEDDKTDEEKAGKRNAGMDQRALDEAHDLLVKAGANCKTSSTEDESDDSEKAKVMPNLKLLTEIAELETTTL